MFFSHKVATIPSCKKNGMAVPVLQRLHHYIVSPLISTDAESSLEGLRRIADGYR